MASVERRARTSHVPISDVVAFSDVELDRYLDDHRSSNGAVLIDGEGLENLPKDQQDRFIQRLRARAGGANAAVDLNEERMRYQDLIDDGARPLYPLELLDDVFENPTKYKEMLSIWSPTAEWMAFTGQMQRWRFCRLWQKDHRGLRDDEAEFLEELEDEKRVLAAHGDTKSLATFDDNPGYEWEKACWLKSRNWRRKRYRERIGDGGFLEYARAVKQRLARHNFTRDFQLEQDFNRQDKLTTWIEYLYFEYWCYDQYVAQLKALQPRYDAAWKELVDSGSLRPEETEESIWDIRSSFQRQNEQDAAYKALQVMKKEAESVYNMTKKDRRDPKNSRWTTEERQRMIREARIQLESAKEVLKALETRNEQISIFCQKARNYEIIKDNMYLHERISRWVREQVPLIEAELNEARDARAGSQGVPSAPAERRSKRNRDVETLDENPAKHYKMDRNDPGRMEKPSGSTETVPAPKAKPNRLGRRVSNASATSEHSNRCPPSPGPDRCGARSDHEQETETKGSEGADPGSIPCAQ